MKSRDTIEFRPVDVAALRAEAEAATPRTYTLADGRRLDELATGAGIFCVTSTNGRMQRHVTEARIDYAPTLGEQFLQMRGAA